MIHFHHKCGAVVEPFDDECWDCGKGLPAFSAHTSNAPSFSECHDDHEESETEILCGRCDATLVDLKKDECHACNAWLEDVGAVEVER